MIKNTNTKINKNAKNKTDKKVVLKLLLKLLKPYIPHLIVALIFTAVQVAATLLVPVIIGRAIDSFTFNGVDFDSVLRHILYIIAATLGVFVFQWLGGLITNKVGFSVVRDIRTLSFNKLNRVPVKTIDNTSHGDIISRIVNDAEAVSDGLIHGFTQLFSGIVTVIGTIAFMFSINVKIALIVILITPLSIVVSYFIAKGNHKMFSMQSKTRGKLSGLSEEMLSNQKLVKTYMYDETAEKRFNDINGEFKKYGEKAMFYSSITNPTTRFINGIVYAAVTVFGAITVITNPAALSVGMLSSFLTYANQYSKPFNEITGVITELQTSLASLKRIDELLKFTEEENTTALPALKNPDGSIEFDNVGFGYSDDRPLIKDFSLKVKKGQRVAIVGPTGCGKTTLINLLMRFYDIKSGSIFVSGNDIFKISRESLRDNFGMVLQDTWLFSGTIKENIAYGKEDATDDEIIEAAKKAHIHNFIMRQDKGYDTHITEGGGNISQGQRQLLCIARIMLKAPPMLILDEATSNIDTRTEQHIQSAFKQIMTGRTSFIIAHRLSTIMDADIILAMQNGNVVESGTHAELMQKEGFYAYLYNSQFATY